MGDAVGRSRDSPPPAFAKEPRRKTECGCGAISSSCLGASWLEVLLLNKYSAEVGRRERNGSFHADQGVVKEQPCNLEFMNTLSRHHGVLSTGTHCKFATLQTHVFSLGDSRAVW